MKDVGGKVWSRIEKGDWLSLGGGEVKLPRKET